RRDARRKDETGGDGKTSRWHSGAPRRKPAGLFIAPQKSGGAGVVTLWAGFMPASGVGFHPAAPASPPSAGMNPAPQKSGGGAGIKAESPLPPRRPAHVARPAGKRRWAARTA